MNIEYRQTKNASHIYDDFFSYLQELIQKPEIKRVCEVGGGANPAIPLDLIEKYEVEYTLLDISSEELEKAPNGYHKIQADIASPNLNLHEQYDLIFSIMLAEHVQDGAIFHKNVLNLLQEGGYALHVFPTFYALPFVANQLLPEKLAKFILWTLAPHRITDDRKLKFPAYYSWCRGPLKSQINKFENLGYQVQKYIGFFGTPAYFRRVKAVNLLDKWISSLLVKKPNPLITSYAYVLLKKNHDAINS